MVENATYYYWYPDDNSTQYLYESFGNIVNPIDGIQNEHFINWMRTAGLPEFRKYYGKIDYDFVAGDSLTFNITTNYEVQSFGGAKSLVITQLTEFGSKNAGIGKSYLAVGCINLIVGILFLSKRWIRPRPLGDIRQLDWGNSY
jgi:LEM3 (ligand-effect modulator 3) family / CDC50 family